MNTDWLSLNNSLIDFLVSVYYWRTTQNWDGPPYHQSWVVRWATQDFAFSAALSKPQWSCFLSLCNYTNGKPYILTKMYALSTILIILLPVFVSVISLCVRHTSLSVLSDYTRIYIYIYIYINRYIIIGKHVQRSHTICIYINWMAQRDKWVINHIYVDIFLPGNFRFARWRPILL